jgi:GTP-binding protein
LIIEATFVTSAATATGLPHDGLAEIALVGRSNVGKSSLINALVRQRVARTSAAPGKTRLANVYRVARGSGEPFYLVDLPGYGYARGAESARGFEELTRGYFDRVARAGRVGRVGKNTELLRDPPDLPDPLDTVPVLGALLLVDARHPGLASDLDAWRWLTTTVEGCAVVATKIDKLSRAERLRALKANEAAFEHPVLPVSASTGEGLDELWKLIERLTSRNPNNRRPPRHLRPPRRLPKS